MKFITFKDYCILSLLLIILLFSSTKEDLPVHCLKSQIVGEWSFTLGKTIKLSSPSEKYSFTCEHAIPSHESTSYLTNDKKDKLQKEKVINVSFFKDNTFTSSNNITGKWTMIYDEGFEFVMSDNEKYFVFSKYDKKQTPGSKWTSYCHSTLLGWFYKGDHWGCFYGNKKNVDLSQATNGEVENKQFYVQPSGSALKNFRFSQTTVQDFINVFAEFRDHAKYVSMINNANFAWKAKHYSVLNGKSIGQIKELIHGKKFYIGNTPFIKQNGNFMQNGIKGLELKAQPSNGEHLNSNAQTITLPKHFNWLNHISEARQQGNCGSCYAMSFISALEARFRIKYETQLKSYKNYFGDDLKKFSLSVNHVIKCSYYNQGCDGGYSYLVGKFFNEFEVYLDQCFDASKNQCTQYCKEEELNNIHLGVSDYYYVGGAYGKSNEKNIMRDLYLNGPLTISFEPEENFATYSSGVYTGTKKTINEIVKAYNKKYVLKRPQWEKVDHSILLVGWGEEEIDGNIVKYWVIQNSWGTQWGKNGFGKFLRGVDLDGIESIAEAAIPLIK